MATKHKSAVTHTHVRQTAPAWRSEGQRLLSEVEDTLLQIAHKTGAGKTSVSQYLAGASTPNRRRRNAIAQAYGIPQVAWDLAPHTEITTPDAQQTTANQADPETIGADTVASTSSLQECFELIARAKTEANISGLSHTERQKNTATLAKLLALRERLESRQELLEDRIVREHPAFRRAVQAVTTALTPYPEAARAVVQALRKLDLV